MAESKSSEDAILGLFSCRDRCHWLAAQLFETTFAYLTTSEAHVNRSTLEGLDYVAYEATNFKLATVSHLMGGRRSLSCPWTLADEAMEYTSRWILAKVQPTLIRMETDLLELSSTARGTEVQSHHMPESVSSSPTIHASKALS